MLEEDKRGSAAMELDGIDAEAEKFCGGVCSRLTASDRLANEPPSGA
jgi:hypothetical protein